MKELWHLSEADGTATLERTFLEIDKETHEVLVAGRTSGTLREIATQPDGVVVWGFRDGGDAVVVVKRAHVGVESTRPPRDDETPMVPAFSSECAFGAARIDVRAPEKGATAQLVGGLPPKGTGKEQVFPRFMVDVSVSRVARDPEPVLAARIRVRD